MTVLMGTYPACPKPAPLAGRDAADKPQGFDKGEKFLLSKKISSTRRNREGKSWNHPSHQQMP